MNGFYRNIATLTSIEGIEVDAAALWVWNASLDLLVLIDDDQFVSHIHDSDVFYKVEE